WSAWVVGGVDVELVGPPPVVGAVVVAPALEVGGVVPPPLPPPHAAANSARVHVKASAPRNFCFLTFSPFSVRGEDGWGEGIRVAPGSEHHLDGRRIRSTRPLPRGGCCSAPRLLIRVEAPGLRGTSGQDWAQFRPVFPGTLLQRTARWSGPQGNRT